jgi:hypothetical protein
MSLSQLDLNDLVALDALLTERPITRAANRCNVTQSAMSHTLKRLRDVRSRASTWWRCRCWCRCSPASATTRPASASSSSRCGTTSPSASSATWSTSR